VGAQFCSAWDKLEFMIHSKDTLGFTEGNHTLPHLLLEMKNQHNNTQLHQSGKSQLVPGGY
jgi:hypothetical protein